MILLLISTPLGRRRKGSTPNITTIERAAMIAFAMKSI
jgi:hypothetical protein